MERSNSPPMWKRYDRLYQNQIPSPSLTPFGDVIFYSLEEACLLFLANMPMIQPSPEVEYAYYDLEGTILLLYILLLEFLPQNSDPHANTKSWKYLTEKSTIAWKLSDIKGINPEFCSHKILMEATMKPAVHIRAGFIQRSMSPCKKEVEKLLEAGLIYPISDSPWVSPVQLYQRMEE
ncbi:hypothetical protein Tco_0873480 [Tanacetum coccineum]|uniref:Uncharacterized protein n=1 Tax=Tanacetum coccineum TaxID=301880 RepID=A0ABQ5BN30_9ASTR